jgi:Peptidase C13 family
MLTALARNLGAGVRLAFGLPVRRLSFRIDLAQLLLVFAFSSLIDIGGDWLRYGPDAQFSWLGAGNELFTLGLLIVVATLIAIVRRRASLALALPVIVLSGAPVIQAADVMLAFVVAVNDIPQFAASWLAYAIPAWFVAMIVRSTWIAFEGEGRRRLLRTLVAGAVLAAPTWLAGALFQPMPWWQGESSSTESGAGASPVSELVQAAQQQLLDDALGALADERPGVVDLYFVGFAADAREPSLRDDVVRAQRVMDERWDTRGRSIVLANHPETLIDTPFATVTHLRETLREIGATIDQESDVVMIYVAGRGGAAGVDVAHPPLDLLPLSPSTLRALLEDAGIKRRIVVVSACRSGAFHDALADESTVVLTTSAREDAGCATRRGGAAIGDALFGDALAERDSFADALDAAARTLAATDGKPALSIGPAIGDTLKALDRRNSARRDGRSI